jgi:hypothetical protein
MKRITAFFAALLLAAPAVSQNNSPYSTARPPERFQEDGASIVLFVDDVSKVCGTPPKGRIIACVRKAENGTPIMVLPNPCLVKTEVYSHIVCHELGHINGWGGRHEE